MKSSENETTQLSPDESHATLVNELFLAFPTLYFKFVTACQISLSFDQGFIGIEYKSKISKCPDRDSCTSTVIVR